MRPLPSVSQNPKTTNLGFYLLQNAPFQALDFTVFWRTMPPDHSKAYNRMTSCASYGVLAILVKTLASIPMICQLMHASCPELYLLVSVLQTNVLIRGVDVLEVRWVVP